MSKVRQFAWYEAPAGRVLDAEDGHDPQCVFLPKCSRLTVVQYTLEHE